MSNLRQQSCNEIDLVSGGEKMDPPHSQTRQSAS